MIDDIIIIKKAHRVKASIIVDHVNSLPNRSIIGIQGISGVGKTEIGMLVRQELYERNKTSFLISLDDWYVTDFRDRYRIRKKKGLSYIGLKEIDWKSVCQVLRNFKHMSTELEIQQISKCAETFVESTVYRADKINYLIIEGLYVGYLKTKKLLDFCVHLEGEPSQTLRFRRERMKEDEFSEFRQQVVRREAEVVRELKKFADLVIPYREVKDNTPR